MTHITDNQPLPDSSLSGFFKSRIDALAPSSQKNYRIVAALLSSFLAEIEEETGIDAGEELPVTRDALARWCFSLSIRDVAPRSVSHYLDCAVSLLNAAAKEGLIPEIEDPRPLRDRLRTMEDLPKSLLASCDAISRLTAMSRAAANLSGELTVITDIILFSVINRGMPLSEVAMLTKESITLFSGPASEILSRNAAPRRKFVFSLSQSSFTPRQLRDWLERKAAALLAYRGLPLVGSSVSETARSLWALAAIKCGASPSFVAAMLGYAPAGLPLLGLIDSITPSPAQAEAITEAVTRLVLSNPLQWYAMRFRHGVRFEAVDSRISSLDDGIRRPEIFYPCEEIAKKTGRKLVYENRPFISDIAFFRTRPSDVYPLFLHISDLAWCYRERNEGLSRYSVIPDRAMDRFQQTIGLFTPDYDIRPAGTIPLREGDRVEVIGGLFAGAEATLLRTTEQSAPAGASTPATVYRIIFPDANGIEWRVDIDPRLLRKLPR